MATPGPVMTAERGTMLVAADRRRLRHDLARDIIRRRRGMLIAIGRDAQGPQATSTAEVIVLRKDFVNVVGSSTGTEVEIVVDSDGRIRLYSLGGGGGGGGGTTYFPGGW